jgi:plastocyanin
MGVALRLVRPAVLAMLLSAAGLHSVYGGQSVLLAVTGRDGRPAADVALYLADVHTPLAKQRSPVVDQRGEAFVPAVTVVPLDSDVEFINSDPTSHHVYSFSKPNSFELPLYKGSARLRAHFAKTGVVVLGCNIHDSMLGYVVVVDSTRSGVTGPDGHLTLLEVPAGRHAVRAWAPGLDRANPPELGVVEVSETTPASASFQLDVPGAARGPKQRGSLAGSDY